LIDANGGPGQRVRQDRFYAYVAVGPEPSQQYDPLCVGPNENLFRVRVKRFMLPVAAFDDGDGIVVGEVDSAGLPMLLYYFTPLDIKSPIGMGVCRGHTIYLAGWGQTCTTGRIMLQTAASTLTDIAGSMDGRSGFIRHPNGSCISPCLPGLHGGDSGSPILIDGPNNSLVVIGITQSSDAAKIALRHQFFTDPQPTHYLCEPCGPIACHDVTRPIRPGGPTGPNGLQECEDFAALAALGPRAVHCWCPGDLDGNGRAGDSFDVAVPGCTTSTQCDPNQWCYGDANLDGRVDSADVDHLEAMIAANGVIACASCTSCPALSRWCCGDLNCDSVVDEDDIVIVESLLATYPSGYDCTPTSPGCGETHHAVARIVRWSTREDVRVPGQNSESRERISGRISEVNCDIGEP
jgi:hypothetical protein